MQPLPSISPLGRLMGKLRWIPVLVLILALLGFGLALLLPGQKPVASCPTVLDPDYDWPIAASRLLVKQIRSAFAAPGIAVAVAVDGRVVWSEGLGYADLARQAPACPWTRFRIGSVSKPLTAAAVGLLYEQGQLDLDAPIQEYVPNFPDKGASITTRQLAGHLSGLRHYAAMSELLSRRHYSDVRASLAAFADDPLLFPPGTSFSYSSYGYNLIGAVVEGASGEEFRAYMRDHIFEPLEMNHTLVDDPTMDISNRATFYEDTGQGIEIAPYVDLSNRWPSGGFLSTPEDLVRFASALTDGRLLRPDTVELLFTPLCPACPSVGEREGDYGMGWEIRRDLLGRRRVGHTGSGVGGVAGLLLYPDEKVAFALAMNVGSVTNPDPQLHAVAPDPTWIAELFILARTVNRYGVALLVLGLVIVAVGVIAVRHVKRGRS